MRDLGQAWHGEGKTVLDENRLQVAHVCVAEDVSLIVAAPEMLENLRRCALALFNLAPHLDYHGIQDFAAQEAYEAADGLLRRLGVIIDDLERADLSRWEGR